MSRWTYRSRPALVVSLLVLLALPARADDELPDLPARVVAAHAAQDHAGLQALAAAREHDPWVIVDELLAAGQGEPAIAFAARVAGPDAEALQRYVGAPPEDSPSIRSALHQALRAHAAGDVNGALDAVDGAHAPAGTVLAVRVPALRGRLHLERRAWEAAFTEYSRSAEAAEALGRDLDWESEDLDARFDAQFDAQDFRFLHTTAAQRIAGHARRGDGGSMAQALLDLAVASSRLRLSSACVRISAVARDFLRYLLSVTAESWHRRLEDHVARCETALGMALADTGDFPVALAEGERAVAAARRGGNAWTISSALREFGNTSGMVGDAETALRLYREAEAELRGSDAPWIRVERMRLRINVGHAYQELGRLREAGRELDAALEELDALGPCEEAAIALLNLGEVHEKRGLWTEAGAYYRRALPMVQRIPLLAAYAHVRLGDALARRGGAKDTARLERARKHYEEAIASQGTWQDASLELLGTLGRGEVALARNEATEALAYASDGLAQLDAMTEGLADGEIVAVRGQADRARLLALGVGAAARLEAPERAVEVLERSRAQAFLAALGGRRALLRRALDEEGRRELERANARLTTETVYQRTAIADDDLPAARRARRALQSARTRYDSTLRRLERRARRYEAGGRPALATLDTLRAKLQPREVFVFYAVLDPTSYAVVVQHDGASFVPLEGRTDLAQRVDALRAGEAARAPTEIAEDLEALRARLLVPLRLPEDTERLMVSPDGPLAHVPWPMLLADSPWELVDLALAPSATVWTRLAAPGGARGHGKVALGDPIYEQRADERVLKVYVGSRPLRRLEQTAAEVRAITGEGDTVLLREHATEAGLAAALEDRGRLRALHLACHGLLDPRSPAFSALALTPADADDGFLTALEVYLLEIPADLVVLSACDTARDRTAAGEGLTGLTRAFHLAGATRVLASLWPVDDQATRDLMEHFYEEWEKPGATAAGALRAAQAHVRESRPHPRDWGAWVLWGRSD